ncbi:MAG: hypothetical protein AAF684_03035 [Pseudomonadota bacterium]
MSGPLDSRALLAAERDRKTALRESFERQLAELGRRRARFSTDRATLERDAARLRPAAPRLEHELKTIAAQDARAEGEERRIRVDINALQKEIMTLTHQIAQLSDAPSES